MKHKLLESPAKLTVVAFLCLFCFTGSVCDPVDAVDEGPCGEETAWDMIWTAGSSNPSNPNMKWSFGLDGETRTAVLYQEEIPEDMCSDEHVLVSYYASMIDVSPGTIKIFGQASWSLFERTTQLVQESAGSYKVRQEIGLKQAFPDEPGYLSAQLKFTFKSRGGVEIDSAYLVGHMDQVSAHIHYKKFKD